MKRVSAMFFGSAVLALSTLSSTQAFGQQNYQPAKVITLTGDTLQGLIDYKGWDRNPKRVEFKSDIQAPAQTFRPLEIKAFKVNNELYTGAQVSVEDSPQNLDNLTTSATPILRNDTTFLQALVTGPKSLYKYKTGGREYFYLEQQGKFDLLVYKRYKPSSTYTVIYFNNLYQGQLSQYLSACSTIEQRSKIAHYTSSSIQGLFTTYYRCTKQQAGFLRKKNTYQTGVLVGATSTTLSISTSVAGLAPSFDNYTTYAPTGGIFFYIPLPGNLGHFSINNELTFNSFKTSGTTTVSASADNYTTTSSSLSLAYLKLNTLLRFTRPVGTGALFINAGMSNGYAFQAESDQTVVSTFYSSKKTTTGKAFSELQRYEPGFVAGLGGSVKRFSAEARYEHSSGFLNLINIGSSFQRYSLLVGYRLF